MEKFLVVISFIVLGVGAAVNVSYFEQFHNVDISQLWRSNDVVRKGTVLDHVEYVACDKNIEEVNSCINPHIKTGSLTGNTTLIESLVNGGSIMLSLK
ncbi:MAG: hypothetical protein OCC49_04290 [Fibrobacterales bacterium]